MAPTQGWPKDLEMRIKYDPQILVRSIALKGFCTGNLEVNKSSFLNSQSISEETAATVSEKS